MVDAIHLKPVPGTLDHGVGPKPRRYPDEVTVVYATAAGFLLHYAITVKANIAIGSTEFASPAFKSPLSSTRCGIGRRRLLGWVPACCKVPSGHGQGQRDDTESHGQ
ncbi:hypothetical protein [Reyranella sp. CPCC 100927]|uniref:hypothetical protein n=1 Tax=Reyranella sp. CPCC 100927 TaxID=2599616 RepID=UPI0011B636C1|nr:hypothetical protein [Reyranella sp. CPCC 100927]TWT15730.1 hypothetical protein FQU96_05145 [Reyranella sp. CPCC 100927]